MTSKAVKRTPHNYSVSRNIRQNRDNTDKALLLFGSVEVTSSILVSSSEKVKRKAFRGMKLRKAFLFTAFLKMDFRGLVVRYVAVYHK